MVSYIPLSVCNCRLPSLLNSSRGVELDIRQNKKDIDIRFGYYLLNVCGGLDTCRITISKI